MYRNSLLSIPPTHCLSPTQMATFTKQAQPPFTKDMVAVFLHRFEHLHQRFSRWGIVTPHPENLWSCASHKRQGGEQTAVWSSGLTGAFSYFPSKCCCPGSPAEAFARKIATDSPIWGVCVWRMLNPFPDLTVCMDQRYSTAIGLSWPLVAAAAYPGASGQM